MNEWIQSFIRHSPFLVMASSNRTGDCDASPRGGKPGFVKILDDTRLVIPDVAGNRLFQSYENFETNPNLGLIFFIPGVNSCVRVNGSVDILRQGDSAFDNLTLEVFSPDENAKLLQALLVTVKQAYSHCPRAVAFSQLWDTAFINENVTNPPIESYKRGT